MSIILLENVRSTYNVGSIFRLASATSVQKIILIGYTPQPIDRMGRDNEKLSKTALGSEKEIEWEHYENTKEAIQKYTDYTPVCVEQTEKAKLYNEKNYEKPLFIFGNEVDGIEKDTLSQCENHIYLPMLGKKESLNVSTCAAVVLYNHITSSL